MGIDYYLEHLHDCQKCPELLKEIKKLKAERKMLKQEVKMLKCSLDKEVVAGMKSNKNVVYIRGNAY